MLHTILSQWQPFLAVFFLLLFWLWETAAPFFARERRVKHAARNLIVSAINGVVIAFVFAGIMVTVADFTEQGQIGLLHWLGLSGAARFIVAFLLVDIWTYWWHRFNHVVPFLWRFHRMHHSDPEMDVTTATRFHVGEIIFSSIIKLVLIPIVGIPIGVLILFDVVQLPIISFHHANIHLPRVFDRTLAWFIVTPFMHKVHHSRIKRETDSNFSSLLSVWDRLFGSFVQKERCEEIKFGLDGFDEDKKQSLKGLLTTPLFRS
jgi:sterol desaturase/sphingolipid hydroxylase (fatty acid hydroxylase superfamily)